MPPSTIFRSVMCNRRLLFRLADRRRLFSILGVLLLCSLTVVEFVNARTATASLAFDHTAPTVEQSCNRLAFTADGNPFGLCPGPFPAGGNCVWWAWEQWHQLDFNLPLNWGNAAEWAIDAERSGLPLGTTPRVGSIAVFPVADGVWAFGAAGHVAFVTWVSPDSNTFNVTYQNYGDPTNMHVGIGYNVSVINEPRFQRGELRFIYFPKLIDSRLFARLPGVSGNEIVGVSRANNTLMTSANSDTLTGTRIALGLPPTSSDQEFNADFTGTGHSDLLLYDRQQGNLKIFRLLNNSPAVRPGGRYAPDPTWSPAGADSVAASQLVSLSDSTTSVNGWGSSLDIHVGDFDGTGRSQILLYDRISGQLQLISLTPDLQIQKHVTLPGWGAGWELYVGRLNGHNSGLFMYNRFANSPLTPVTPSTPPPSTSPSNPPAGTSPTASPKPKPKPSPTATATHTPTPTPTATATATPSPTATATATPTPTATATATPTPTATATAAPKINATPTPTSAPTATATPTATAKLTSSMAPDSGSSVLSLNTSPNGSPGGSDLSGNATDTSQSQSLVPNVMLVDFKPDFSVNHLQRYTLSEDSWEVYTGRFVSPSQDGIFIYDRISGQGRIMGFDASLKLVHNQKIDNLDGNWQVYSGDFNGSGRAQVLLYDPTSGDAQFLIFANDLSLATQKTYSQWGTNQVLYVGHFGMTTLNVMLYDPQAATSTFMAFDSSLEMIHQYTTQSWDQHWQILVGAFIDRSRCREFSDCAAGDDILVLNRETGQLQQYAFSFRQQFKVYDNRSQAFIREGLASEDRLNAVDATTFSLLATLDTSIRNEELY